MGFIKLTSTDIESSLAAETRQYLAGSLSKPQPLRYVHDDGIEVGISSYTHATWEEAHSHTVAREFQYVLNGMTEYRDLATDEVLRFGKGDFYVIDPGTRYIQRIKQNTRILFIKHPGGNDKVPESVSPDVLHWAKEALRVSRLDLKGTEAPPANSLVPAVAAAVMNEGREILLIRRRDSEKWAMPGGTMELAESLEACLRREILEETGLEIEVAGIVGTYTNPDFRIAYSDGEVRREFSIVFLCYPKGRTIALDDESTDFRWVAIDSADSLPMAESQRLRLRDVRAYIDGERTAIR